ncbi:MAG: hypothetical protein ABI554_12175, partial [Flavobacterium sp.]
MKVYSKQSVQHVNGTIEECWAFFSSPRNLQKMTPETMGFQITDFDEKNMYAGQMGFNLEDFTKANSGNLLLAITDLSIGANPGKLNPEDPDKDAGLKVAPTMKFLFATGIGNKPSFQKLVDAGKKIGPGMGIDSKVAFNMNDKFFVLGNDQSYVNSFIAGGKHDFAFTDQLKGHPIGIFVDLKKILTVMNTDSLIKDPGLKSVMNENQKLWNNAYFTGGEMDGDADAETGEGLGD